MFVSQRHHRLHAGVAGRFVSCDGREVDDGLCGEALDRRAADVFHAQQQWLACRLDLVDQAGGHFCPCGLVVGNDDAPELWCHARILRARAKRPGVSGVT